MKGNIYPIILKYSEPGWTAKTVECLRECGFKKWGEADRDGVGSMAKAFNRAIGTAAWRYQYIWFITNVTFTPETKIMLLSAFDDDTAAVHPAMRNSDHPHIRGPIKAVEVPFVEWTAPMIRTSALQQIGLLNEDMPYVHFDLEWSYRARVKGWKLKTQGQAEVKHEYLYRNQPEEISQIRARLRALSLVDSALAMSEAMQFEFENLRQAEQTAKEILKEL